MVGVTVIVPDPLSSTDETTPDAPASDPQVMLPDASVSRTDAVLQFRTVEIFTPPAEIVIPLLKVDVAVPVVLMAKTLRPWSVEEAVVDVALKYGAPIFVPDSIPPLYVVVPVFVNLFRPERVLESARRVVDETVIDPPRETPVPLTVMEEFARLVLDITPADVREVKEIAPVSDTDEP